MKLTALLTVAALVGAGAAGYGTYRVLGQAQTQITCPTPFVAQSPFASMPPPRVEKPVPAGPPLVVGQGKRWGTP